MNRPRIRVGGQDLPELLPLRGDDAHYLERVRRVRGGEEVEVLLEDGSLGLYIMEFIQTSPCLRLKGRLEPRLLRGRLVLLQPLLQRSKLEPVLQKAAELGVNHIALFQAAQGVAAWGASERSAKLRRAEVLLHEASRQCGLNPLPELSCWETLGDALAAVDPGLGGFFLWEEGDGGGGATITATPGLRVCVGPEGGFSQGELEALGAARLRPRRLGDLILRSETASVVALTLANLELGRWAGLGLEGDLKDL